MTSGDWPSINPYEASAEAPSPTADFSALDGHHGTLSAFRRQIHALGGAWIVFGLFLLMFVPTISLRASPSRDFDGHVREGDVRYAIAGIVAASFALAWIGAGIGSYWKKISAVYVGIGVHMALLAVLVALDLLNAAVLGVVTFVVVLQAHRVIGWARELQRLGIPLHAKP